MIVWVVLSSQTLFAVKVVVPVQKRELQSILRVSSVITPAKSEMVRTGWNSMLTSIPVKLGQRVKTGDLVATSNIVYYSQQKAYLEIRREALSRDKNRLVQELKLAQRKQINMNTLAAKDAIPRAEAEKFQLVVLDARKNVLQSEAALKGLEAQIKEVDERVRAANYYSPIEGIISYLIIDPRQFTGTLMTEPGAVLAKIDEPFRFKAVSEVTDTQVSKIEKGTKAQIQIEASDIAFEGIVTQVSPAADPKTGLFKITVEFRKEGPPVPTGITARTVFKEGLPKRALSLPWNAVQVEGDKAWVVSSEKERKPVTLGLRTAERVEILGGLREGDQVEADLW